jgi:phage terminase large subunit
MNVDAEVNPRFEKFIFNWKYKFQLLVGGYGSSKSWHVAFKLVMRCLKKKVKVAVFREVYETHRESTFSLFIDILSKMDILAETPLEKGKIQYRTSPLKFIFPNGSQIIFKGMDKPVKMKSLNGVTIAWLEEAPEIKYDGFLELIGRLRDPHDPIYFILSFNPVDKESWPYKHFFIDEEKGIHKLDDELLYKLKTVVIGDTYYHHSLPEDNLFLKQDYIDSLDELQTYDPDKYRIARLGRFGVNGLRVLPQFVTAKLSKINAYLHANAGNIKHFCGFDFGFEESYNAVVRMAVDVKKQWLFIYDEYYANKMTDPETADELIELGYKDVPMVADSAEPKAIKYYRDRGFKIRKCTKFAGSRIDNTRKVKRFKKIICATSCPNVIRELKNLTYYKDNNGKLVYDKFNIDPHTFSAIWYGLDKYEVTDVKVRKNNSWSGKAA